MVIFFGKYSCNMCKYRVFFCVANIELQANNKHQATLKVLSDGGRQSGRGLRLYSLE